MAWCELGRERRKQEKGGGGKLAHDLISSVKGGTGRDLGRRGCCRSAKKAIVDSWRELQFNKKKLLEEEGLLMFKYTFRRRKEGEGSVKKKPTWTVGPAIPKKDPGETYLLEENQKNVSPAAATTDQEGGKRYQREKGGSVLIFLR